MVLLGRLRAQGGGSAYTGGKRTTPPKPADSADKCALALLAASRKDYMGWVSVSCVHDELERCGLEGACGVMWTVQVRRARRCADASTPKQHRAGSMLLF